MSAQEQARRQRLAAVAEKLKTHGLAGQKLGKHKVPESKVEVQIGEDLSESLRGLKVRFLFWFSCRMVLTRDVAA